VVPPEDPEDWTRPLTWVAALGMLAGPLSALIWFVASPPRQSSPASEATYLVASLVAGGAAATGATQMGILRAWTATLGAGLFGALVVIILGVVTAGERQVGVASPTLAHAFGAAVGGLAGAGAAAVAAGALARRARLERVLIAAGSGVIVAVLAVVALMGTAVPV
jgi:hypothetical protein